MSAPSCCPTSVLPSHFPDSTYSPIGHMRCEYVVQGSAAPKKRSVLFVPDIFGYHPETLKTADEIAKRGNYRVVIPDFFAKTNENPLGPWPMDEEIPASPHWPAFYQHMIAPSTYKSIAAQAARLREQDGVAPLAIGFCWGAKMVSRLAAEGLVACASCPHPSFFKESDAAETKVPFAVFPSIEEDKEDMAAIKAKLEERGMLGAWVDCNKAHHGFSGARYDPKSEDCEQAREAVINGTVEFFQKHE